MRFTQRNIVVLGIMVIILVSANDARLKLLAGVGIIVLMVKDGMRCRANTFKMLMIETDAVNESLVLDCRLAGHSCLFMIDTGYAGPPVLSASYLAAGDAGTGVSERYKKAVQRLEAGVSVDKQNRAIEHFINTSMCLAYTSGCTMRLMGIGETHEQQADMLMCEMLEIKTIDKGYGMPKRSTSNAMADVFVTNPLPSSIHILTCDFLLHSSPALILPADGRLVLNMPIEQEVLWKSRMHMHPMILSGGSFVVDIDVGGESMRCTVDTGAPGPICISSKAAKRIKKHCRRERYTLRQSGVNGEHICSEIVRTDIVFSGTKVPAAVVFVNDSDIDLVDGYVGLGVLRAFDMLLTHNGIGFRRNKNSIRPFESYRSVAHNSTCSSVELPCTITSQ